LEVTYLAGQQMGLLLPALKRSGDAQVFKPRAVDKVIFHELVTKRTFVLLAGYRWVLDVSTVIRRNGDGAHPALDPAGAAWHQGQPRGPSFIVPSEQQTISSPQTGHWDGVQFARALESGNKHPESQSCLFFL
jgi:hypothetical protein